MKTDSNAAANVRINAEKGENAFRAGDYRRAVENFRHAVADDPRNGVLTMLLAQSQFAAGQYNDAARTTQTAMRLLPEDQWDVVVANRSELYAQPRDYLDQLRALDKLSRDKSSDASLRFLAGFHYACLGYPRAALDNFDRGLKLAPQDELLQKLRDKMRASLTEAAANVPPVPQPPPEEKPFSPAVKKSPETR